MTFVCSYRRCDRPTHNEVETLLSTLGQLVWRHYNAACSKINIKSSFCESVHACYVTKVTSIILAETARAVCIPVGQRTCSAASNRFWSTRFVIGLSRSVYISTSLASYLTLIWAALRIQFKPVTLSLRCLYSSVCTAQRYYDPNPVAWWPVVIIITERWNTWTV